MTEYMLTTVDNPFDPFEDFDKWNLFDIEKQYYSCSRLARIAQKDLSDDLSQSEENEVIGKAVDEIIKYDFLDIYKKVSREVNEDVETDVVNLSVDQS